VEVYIICCVTIVAMILRRLRLKATYPSAGKSMDKSELTMVSSCRPMIDLTSIEASACCAGNSRVLRCPRV
jgi:hypothetical protein